MLAENPHTKTVVDKHTTDKRKAGKSKLNGAVVPLPDLE